MDCPGVLSWIPSHPAPNHLRRKHNGAGRPIQPFSARPIRQRVGTVIGMDAFFTPTRCRQRRSDVRHALYERKCLTLRVALPKLRVRTYPLLLERIWQKNQAILRSIVRSVLFDSASVDDVLQDAFIRVFKQGKKFPDEREAYNYLRRAVLNSAIDYYRQRKKYGWRASPLTEYDSATHESSTPLTTLMQRQQEAARSTLLNEVQESLRGLTREQQEAIDLTFNRRGKKLKDICRERGIPYSGTLSS